jgi:hypothetical protein
VTQRRSLGTGGPRCHARDRHGGMGGWYGPAAGATDQKLARWLTHVSQHWSNVAQPLGLGRSVTCARPTPASAMHS